MSPRNPQLRVVALLLLCISVGLSAAMPAQQDLDDAEGDQLSALENDDGDFDDQDQESDANSHHMRLHKSRWRGLAGLRKAHAQFMKLRRLLFGRQGRDQQGREEQTERSSERETAKSKPKVKATRASRGAYHVSSFMRGGCSVTCGRGKRVDVFQYECLPAGTCNKAGYEKKKTRPCHKPACPAKDGYELVSYRKGQCSVTCGKGMRTDVRLYRCKKGSDCSEAEHSKETQRVCYRRRCLKEATYTVASRVPGECSVSCGGGVQTVTATVRCEGKDCRKEEHVRKYQRLCNADLCPAKTWGEYGEYSACSAPCGRGVKSKQRTCSTGKNTDCRGGNRAALEWHFCTEKPCEEINTSPKWGEWSKCTVECGRGIQSRSRPRNSDLRLHHYLVKRFRVQNTFFRPRAVLQVRACRDLPACKVKSVETAKEATAPAEKLEPTEAPVAEATKPVDLPQEKAPTEKPTEKPAVEAAEPTEEVEVVAPTTPIPPTKEEVAPTTPVAKEEEPTTTRATVAPTEPSEEEEDQPAVEEVQGEVGRLTELWAGEEARDTNMAAEDLAYDNGDLSDEELIAQAKEDDMAMSQLQTNTQVMSEEDDSNAAMGDNEQDAANEYDVFAKLAGEEASNSDEVDDSLESSQDDMRTDEATQRIDGSSVDDALAELSEQDFY